MKMTSLVNRNEVPYDIITDPNEVALNMVELNHFRGAEMSVLLHDDDTDIVLVACAEPYDLPFYTAMSGSFPEDIPRDSMTLLRATVMNPVDLPFEMGPEEEAFVIYDDWDFRQFFNMADVVSVIEQTVRIYRNADVELDFTVLIGYELNSTILDLLLKKVEKCIEQNKVLRSRKNRSPW